MIFRADNELYDTSDMVCLDVDGIYFTIYLDPIHDLAFYQTFDDEQGVLIERAPADQTRALFRRFTSRNPGDISPHRDWLRELHPSSGHRPRRRGADDGSKGPNWQR